MVESRFPSRSFPSSALPTAVIWILSRSFYASSPTPIPAPPPLVQMQVQTEQRPRQNNGQSNKPRAGFQRQRQLDSKSRVGQYEKQGDGKVEGEADKHPNVSCFNCG
jgi:hypothetical protein